MRFDGSSCPGIPSGVVRVTCDMDSGSSSSSKMRSGLVRRNNMSPSDGSCSRTRSGLVRIKGFVHSRDCSRTRSGLVRVKYFTDSSEASCARTQDGIVRGSPPVVKDETVTKGPPDRWMEEDMPVGTQKGLGRGSPPVKAVTKDEPVTKELANGLLKEEMLSRTRSGLVRGKPVVEALSKDASDINGLHEDGWQGEDVPARTRSGLVRGSRATKASMDQPVIKGLANGWMKEDLPLGTRSGLVRESLAAKVGPFANGQPDGCLKKDEPTGTRSGLARETLSAKILSKDETAFEGLPDGWRKEYRPRKNGSCQKSDPYYIDPGSGYEFRSLKDARRFLETGDIRQCAMRPKKTNTYDICTTENQTHTNTSSQYTRPRTADKAIQCEILTSEGIMLPWEELISPYRGNNTELTMLPGSESMKAIQGYSNKHKTLEHMSVKPASAQRGPRQTKSVKRKVPNVEVKSKKRKTSPAGTPVRVSPRLAALNIQRQVSVEPEDQIISDLVNREQTIEESTDDQSQMSQSGTMDQIQGNLESTFNELQVSQADTANGMQVMQENSTNHSQLSQVDTVNHIQTNQENTANQLQPIIADTFIPMRTMQGCTANQPTQADTVDDIQANQGYTANQLQSCLVEAVIPIQEYTTDLLQLSNTGSANQIQVNQEKTANQEQPSLADTVIPVCAIQEYTTDYSQPSKAAIINQIQADQGSPTDQLLLSQVDTATETQIFQENMSKQPQLGQADTVDQIHINLENTISHLLPNYAENPMLQAGFSWAPEQNGGTPIVDFWKNVENQESSIPMQDGAPVASFPANVKFQNAAAPEPGLPTQAALPETAPDQSGLAFQSLFGNSWSDPCIEFAFKTLTGDIPILDDTTAVTDYFPEQQDLNKGTTPNCSASAFDNTRNHTQVDVNLPVPTQSDNFYNDSWFPPQ